MNLKKKSIAALVYFATLLLVIKLYSPVLDFFFFQDDFFEINISQAKNFNSYLDFFTFRNDIIAYRPISLQNYFFFSSTIFDFNPIGFRTITVTILLLSSLLVIKVISQISQNRNVGLLTAIFWLTSSIHFMSVTWIAAAYNIIGTFFFLLTSWAFLKYLKNRNSNFYLLSFILFLITIGSFEFSVTWPIIFLGYQILGGKSLKKSLMTLAPFILISILYLAGRFSFIKIPQIPEYQIQLNLESLKALIWYCLWALNIPEEFKKQVTHNLFFLNQTFLWEFWPLIIKTVTAFVWLVATAFLFPFYFIIRQNKKIKPKKIIFFLYWFVSAISPVLLLPNHTFIMYLTLSSIGLYAISSYLLIKSGKSYLLIITLSVWIFSSITTINFYKSNFWMIEAQKFASDTFFDLKKQFPNFQKNSTIFFRLSSGRHIQALLNQEAVKAFYNDLTISIYYNKESLTKDFRQGRIKGPVHVYQSQ